MKVQSLKMGFPVVLQDYFGQRLINQLNATPRTVASYRDTFRLLLRFASDRLKKPPAAFSLADLNAPLVLAFLDHLEKARRNGIRTRNARLAAIRSFVHYASLQEPAWLATAQQVLAIPLKRFQRPLVGFLSREEINALIEAPDPSTWSGRRDRVMFATIYNVGARVSEAAELRVKDVALDQSAHVTIHGKGRKERTVPLWKDTTRRLKEWRKHFDSKPDAPLFPNRHGHPLTRSGIENRLKEAVRRATQTCRSLSVRNVTPHILRHTTAMHMLQSGLDISVIALWLGHESSSTTHMYVEADLSMKERALSKVQAPSMQSLRYRTKDEVLQFLENL
jgi:integrase/recombinase XerD